MTEHPSKGLSKAAIAAFEKIAVNQSPECGWKTLDTLMNNALIDRSEDTVKHVLGGVYRVPNYFVPIAVHAQWCAWCSERPEALDAEN